MPRRGGVGVGHCTGHNWPPRLPQSGIGLRPGLTGFTRTQYQPGYFASLDRSPGENSEAPRPTGLPASFFQSPGDNSEAPREPGVGPPLSFN